MAKEGINLSWLKGLGRSKLAQSRKLDRRGDRVGRGEILDADGGGLGPPGVTIVIGAETFAYPDDTPSRPKLARPVAVALARIGADLGTTFGDTDDPLFLSVKLTDRGLGHAPAEIMTDIGLNDETVTGLGRNLGSERQAWDRYRRFIQSYAVRVLKIEDTHFADCLEMARDENLFASLEQMQAVHWQKVVAEFKDLVARKRARPFPQDVEEQLWGVLGLMHATVCTDMSGHRDADPVDGDPVISVQAMPHGSRRS